MLSIALLIIGILSVGFAGVSLIREIKRTEAKKAEEVKKSLAKGRVLFYSPSSSSPSEE